MAKTSATAAAPVTSNRSQLIRDYKKAHPEATPSDIAKALTKGTVVVSAALAGQVLNGRKNGKGKMDFASMNELIKSAGEFVKRYKGKVEEAAADIEAVGAFIDSCGSSEAALAALVAFKDLRASMG